VWVRSGPLPGDRSPAPPGARHVRWGKGTVRGQIRVVAVAAMLGVVATSSLTDARPRRTERRTADVRVDVVGDSLVRQAGTGLRHRLDAAGYRSTVAAMPARDLASSFVQQQLDGLDRHEGDVLVLATEANDATRHADRAEHAGPVDADRTFEESVRRAVERFGDRCVVIVNAREDIARIYHPDDARMVNESLRRLAPQYGNLVVVDWAEESRHVPAGEFAPDQLHFGPDPAAPTEGSGSAERYADAILAGIARCPERP
jgi:hypothetical protein